jgi:hypothetical protein
VINKERTRAAKEAARLLYYNFVEDYKSAKEVAASSLGVRTFPDNLEVVMELNKLADEIEGTARRELLIDMRKNAFLLMEELASFNSKLVGSVWRGAARKGSDIDIIAYSEKKEAVVDLLLKKHDNVRTEYISKTSKGKTERYFHIYFTIPQGYDVEIVVRSPEEMYNRNKCDIYGDFIVGLTGHQLGELLNKDATKKFFPK